MIFADQSGTSGSGSFLLPDVITQGYSYQADFIAHLNAFEQLNINLTAKGPLKIDFAVPAPEFF